VPGSEYRLQVVIPGQPRAKVCRRLSSVDPEREHREILRQHFRGKLNKPWSNGVSITVTFFRSNYQRIDLDNLVKAVLDAATDVIWIDDVQVVELHARLEFDADHPRTEVLAEPCSTSMPRGAEVGEQRTCPTCGKAFQSRSYRSVPAGQIHCSKACVGTQPKDCPTCEKRFKPKAAQQRYCSKPCAAASAEVKRKIALKRKRARLPKCLLCSAQLHRKEAILCRCCWLKDAPKGKGKADIIREFEATGRIEARRHRNPA
jgi:Holliday junction resolvase RusA-like endonuclease